MLEIQHSTAQAQAADFLLIRSLPLTSYAIGYTPRSFIIQRRLWIVSTHVTNDDDCCWSCGTLTSRWTSWVHGTILITFPSGWIWAVPKKKTSSGTLRGRRDNRVSLLMSALNVIRHEIKSQFSIYVIREYVSCMFAKNKSCSLLIDGRSILYSIWLVWNGKVKIMRNISQSPNFSINWNYFRDNEMLKALSVGLYFILFAHEQRVCLMLKWSCEACVYPITIS